MNLKSRKWGGGMRLCIFFWLFVDCDLDPTVYFGVYLHENLFKRNDAICCICVIERRKKKYGKLYYYANVRWKFNIFFFSQLNILDRKKKNNVSNENDISNLPEVRLLRIEIMTLIM